MRNEGDASLPHSWKIVFRVGWAKVGSVEFSSVHRTPAVAVQLGKRLDDCQNEEEVPTQIGTPFFDFLFCF